MAYIYAAQTFIQKNVDNARLSSRVAHEQAALIGVVGNSSRCLQIAAFVGRGNRLGCQVDRNDLVFVIDRDEQSPPGAVDRHQFRLSGEINATNDLPSRSID